MQDYLNKALRSRMTVAVLRMKWTLGILGALLAAGAAAPSSRPKASASANMSQEGVSEPITIPTTTQNIFGDVVSVTPPEAESIELRHLNDDTRFYPDYGDKDPINDAHFTGSPDNSRTKRQLDYNDLTYEMYVDPTYNSRVQRDAEEPLRIDLDIPGDSDSDTSDAQTARGTASDPDSLSTQVTYVILSEDDSSSDEAVMKNNFGEHTTDVIDLDIPSSEQGTTNCDSSSSTDSVAERNRVLGAISRTIRTKNQRRRSRSDTDEPSSSSARMLTRKRRQVPKYRLPDFLNYRVGRSASEPDSDDTEPDDAFGLNEKDLSMDGTDVKEFNRVVPLPEYAYEFSELTRPASTYVDGKLQSYYVPERQKRGLPSTTPEPTTEPPVDIVTASYFPGIDVTKDNLSLPEGNFLGPRVYAKGELLQEEQPAVTGIIAPMEKEKTIPVKEGTQIDDVYSAPVNNLNLPLIIPVVAPTSHPGEQARIELTVPSGYVPYIIQLTPTNSQTSDGSTKNEEDPKSQTAAREDETTTAEDAVTSPKPEGPTYFSSVPTIIMTPSTPTSLNEVSTQTNIYPEVGQSSEAGIVPDSTTASWKSGQDQAPVSDEKRSASKQKRAEWKSISSAHVGEIEEPRAQTASWEFASNAPTSGIITQPTSSWKSVPVGEEELPKQRTAKWESISDAPAGAVEEPRDSIFSTPSILFGNSESVHNASAEEEKQTGSWKSVPVGEQDLPMQQSSTSEPFSNTQTGETVTGAVGSSEQRQSVTITAPSFESSKPRSPDSEPERSDQEAPIKQKTARTGKRTNTIPILEENSVMSPNGSFSYSYKSGNGIKVQESGYLKQEPVEEGSTGNGVVQTVHGSYSYTAPNGRLISVRYVADKGGFQPEVEDLPSER